MDKFLLSPPVAFIVFLALSYLVSQVTKLFAIKGKESVGKNLAYACGEDVLLHKVQPDFSQFFPFAFFFTIMHIITLIITTIPRGIPPLAVVYILVAFLAIFILYKR